MEGETCSTLRRPYRNFTCVLCSQSFSTKPDLENHTRTHTNEKPFGCNRCDYAATHSSNLRRHQKLHTGEKPYACPIRECHYRCAEKWDLKKHLKTHDKAKVRAEMFKCEHCHYQAINRHVLVNHTRVHEDRRPFACDVEGCDFRSNWATCLTKHRRCHFGDVKSNQVPCPNPGCKFVTVHRGSMKRHLQVHAGEKPYSCDSCDYSARTKFNLTYHVRSKHATDQVRTVSCPLCPKLFFTTKRMQQHTITHTREKIFRCPRQNCEFSSHYRASVWRHVKSKHQEDRNS